MLGGIIAFITILLYMPFVQQWSVSQLEKVLDKKGMKLRVEKLRLRFPLSLEGEELFFGLNQQDTTIYLKRFNLDLSPRSLLSGEVRINRLVLDSTRFFLDNDTTLQIDTRLASATLNRVIWRWSTHFVEADTLALKAGVINLILIPDSSSANDSISKPFDWAFGLNTLLLEEISYRMDMHKEMNISASIADGKIDRVKIAIGEQSVSADALSLIYAGCEVNFLSEKPKSFSSVNSVKSVISDTTYSKLWSIELQKLRLRDSYYRMNSSDSSVFPLDFYDISVDMDSVFNRGVEIRTYIENFTAKQRSGIEIKQLSGYINFFNEQIDVDSLVIETLNSRLHFDIYAAGSIANIVNKELLYGDIHGFVGLADLLPFYPMLNKEFITKEMTIDSRIAIDKKQLRLYKLELSMKNNFELLGNGGFVDFMKPKMMEGEVTLTGIMYSSDLLNTLLKNRINLPKQLHLKSNVALQKGNGKASCIINSSEGFLTVGARFSLADTSYSLSLQTDSLNIGRILMVDKLGYLTCHMAFEGRRLKFPGMEGIIHCQLDRLDYNGYNYRGLNLNVRAEENNIRLVAKSDSEALQAVWRARVDTLDGGYRIYNRFDIKKLNLFLLNFSQGDHFMSFNLDLDGNIGPHQQHLALYIDSLQVTPYEGETQRYLPISLDGSSNKKGTQIQGNSGDMDLTVSSFYPLDTVIIQFKTIIQQGKEQYRQEIFNVDTLINKLPDLRIEFRGGARNGINGLLSNIGMRFSKILFLFNSSKDKLQLTASVEDLVYQGVDIDTISINLDRDGNQLNYATTVVKRQPGVREQFRFSILGNIEGDRVLLRLRQATGAGKMNFNLGFKIYLYSQSLVIHMEEDELILAGEPWQVNGDNYFVFTKSRVIQANLRLSYQNKLAYIYSANDNRSDQNTLHVIFKELYLDHITSAFPFLPSIGGKLNSDITLYASKLHTGVNGRVSLDNFMYNKFNIGDLKMDMAYNVEVEKGLRKVDFTLHLDSIRRAVINGVFTVSDRSSTVDVNVLLDALPLRTVNAFVSSDLLRLSGELNGRIHLTNTFKSPKLNGRLYITNGDAFITMVGTKFVIDSTEIPIHENEIQFNNFRFYAPNRSYLNILGKFTMHDLTHIVTDLTCKASDFQLIDVGKSDSVMIYGKGYANINATLRGDLAALRFMGNISILSRSELNYVVSTASQTSIQNKASGLVQFVVFADTTQNNYLITPVKYVGNNFTLKLFIDIASDVKLMVQLPGGSSNTISIVGGGNLIFGITDTEGMTLYGKYTIKNGTVRYSIPVVGTKVFNIHTGSYVEWLGNAMDPRLSITAGEEVKANVQLEGQPSRLVQFDAIIKIENSLQHPQILFDLNSPNDMTIQSQLATFSPEERSKQAMNLLIYGTYNGPGAVKSTNVGANSALYSFVEGELNQWSKRLVKNADLSFGVETYDQYTASGQGSIRTDYSYQFSKQFFNDRILVKVGGSITTDSDPQQSFQENLIDDIDVEYKLSKHQNLFIKVFRHTDFVSILEGDITETGLGIVWRKQFRSWRSLFLKAIKESNKD